MFRRSEGLEMSRTWRVVFSGLRPRLARGCRGILLLQMVGSWESFHQGTRSDALVYY